MAEVLFFILGALFCLALLAAVLALLPAPVMTAPAAAGSAGKGQSFEGRRPQHRTGPSYRTAPNRARGQLPPPEQTRDQAERDRKKERDTYRLMASLDRVEATLVQISKLEEPAAAKIAGQTLKRLRSGDAPAPARLAFALNRLELLSLRPEPMARLAARRVLNSFA